MCPAAITALLFDENLKRAFSRGGGGGGIAEWRVARRMGGRKYYWRSWSSPPYRFLTEVSYEVSSLRSSRASRRSFLKDSTRMGLQVAAPRGWNNGKQTRIHLWNENIPS